MCIIVQAILKFKKLEVLFIFVIYTKAFKLVIQFEH